MKNSLKIIALSVVSGFSLAASYASAATIDWNTWTSATSGTIGAVSVTFTANGSTDNLVTTYPSYTPTATYADGTVVANAPSSSNGIIQLTGGNGNINTITFSTPVVDPVMVIWSLGQGGINASFDFTNATPVFVAGGASNEYSGQAITVNGNNVYGSEGNGTVEFMGTFSSISWTNPVYENWYGFNVGIAGTANNSSVPEPSTLMLFGFGISGLAWCGRKLKQA